MVSPSIQQTQVTLEEEKRWLQIADDIMNGKFNKADRQTLKSLIIGLRSIPHPRCRKAHVKIKSMMK